MWSSNKLARDGDSEVLALVEINLKTFERQRETLDQVFCHW